MRSKTVKVSTEEDRKRRQEELKSEDKERIEELERKRKNFGFTQVYPKGWETVRELSQGSPAGLYALLAENIDPLCGAVIADQGFLADQLQVNRRTISRWVRYLEDHNKLVKIPVAGRVCAYALDPAEVWKGYNTSKNYAAFYAKTLVGKDGTIRKRLKAMLQAKTGQKDLKEKDKEDLQPKTAKKGKVKSKSGPRTPQIRS